MNQETAMIECSGIINLVDASLGLGFNLHHVNGDHIIELTKNGKIVSDNYTGSFQSAVDGLKYLVKCEMMPPLERMIMLGGLNARGRN